MIQLCMIGVLAAAVAGCGKNDASGNGESQEAGDKAVTQQEVTEDSVQTAENENSQDKENGQGNDSNKNNSEKSDEKKNVSDVLKTGADNEIGFKSKSYADSENLTEGQKKVQQYFNTDGFGIGDTEYEFLQRYPDVFQGTELGMSGRVKKIISVNGNQYEMLVWIGPNEETVWKCYGFEYEDYYNKLREETKQNLVVVKGVYENGRWIEGDEIAFEGTYQNVQLYEVDGMSYHLPVVDAYNVYIDDAFDPPVLYDAEFIKEVAKNIFGEDIMITQGDPSDDFEDYYRNHEDYWKQILNGWYYTCELENQSNAKFSKYYFFSQFGLLMDAKSTDKVQRFVEFAPDFQHFFLVIADNQLNTLTLEYYDKDLKKIWKQEFSETVSATYDYTSTHVYVVVNNELHIFDIATGEATIEPAFVGEKDYMRKLKDGILVLDGSSSADSIMKIDMDGKILWKNNTEGKIVGANVQIVDDKIILYVSMEGVGSHYMVIDNATGEIVTDAVSLSN